jgi:hypothetical protein
VGLENTLERFGVGWVDGDKQLELESKVIIISRLIDISGF